MVGWVYPHAAVIDSLGLNDWVVARTAIVPHHERVMAHDRWPPGGYLSELKPLLWVREGKSTPQERATPLTDEEVREVEQHWRAWVEAQPGGEPGGVRH
jgi:arabinofuranosyltransferase